MEDHVVIRHPIRTDGAAIWRLVAETSLAQNSPYIYLLMCDHFAPSCSVVEQNGTLVGLCLGFILPDKKKTLFIWQIGIKRTARGKKLARRQLLWLLEQNRKQVKFLEATVTRSNAASRALFRSVARQLQAECTEQVYLTPDLYPTEEVDDDLLFRIGPIPAHD